MTKSQLSQLPIHLFSLDEASKILRINRKKLEDFVMKGEIEIVMLDDRRKQITYEQIERFIHKNSFIYEGSNG